MTLKLPAIHVRSFVCCVCNKVRKGSVVVLLVYFMKMTEPTLTLRIESTSDPGKRSVCLLNELLTCITTMLYVLFVGV